MTIRILKYSLTGSPLVTAFIDVILDERIVINGLNFNRDGTLSAPQLKFWLNGSKQYCSAVVIPDAELAERLTAERLAVIISAYVDALPPDQRALPPRHTPSARPQKGPLKSGKPERSPKPAQKTLMTNSSEGLPQPARATTAARPRLIAGRAK